MKNMTNIWITILLCFVAPSAFSQATALNASKIYPGWAIDFLKISDPASKDNEEYSLSMFFFPKRLERDIAKKRINNKYYVDNFGFNNSPPQIVTVFYDTKNGTNYAIVLIRWHISALGADTLADYYQIIAYRLFAKGSLRKLIKDESISTKLGEGYDGQEDGKLKVFKWKTADAIKNKFQSLEN